MKPMNKIFMITLLTGLVIFWTSMNESHASNTQGKVTFVCENLLFVKSLYQFEETDSVISDSEHETTLDENAATESAGEGSEDIMDVQPGDSSVGDLEMNHVSVDSREARQSSADSLETSYLSDIQTGKTVKFPFYRRWWFSFIILLPVFLIMRRSHLKREENLNEIIEKQKEEIETVNEQLLDTENHFEKTQKEQADRLEAEKELRYHADGISRFSDILSKNKSNSNVLGQKIVSELVTFVGANSGAMYLLKEENNEEPRLEFFGGFAPDLSQIHSSFKVGEGYVGACFKEGKTMELSNTGESFMKVYSGLGEASPSHLVFVPLKQDEFKIGVVEVASFRKLDEFKIRFIEDLSENIASTLALNQANEKMLSMLEQSKIQAKELQTREEELRQNLEEMHATQEDLNRQMEKNKKMQDNLIKEKALLDSLLNSLPDYIFFKDLNSKFIRISKSMLPLFPVKNVDEMIGKSDADFQESETVRKYYEEEMEIIKTGKGFIDKVIHEVMENGYEQWSSTSKMPLLDETGKCIGTYGITKNITDLKKLEMDAKERAEKMLSQEEELRQNLEEMQTVQEELQRQKEELSKEKTLMDALLANAGESIYFKDEKSRFIKVSDSMAKLFKVKKVEYLYGKSDFDFFTEEHARPAFEDEMNIIKTGKPILNKIEKETHPDGRIGWVSTSKMPLRNSAGKIIGTFGISKNITDLRKMEMDIKEKNEALQAQEEELRQNLEEMHTIHEDMEKQLKENEKLTKKFKEESALLNALLRTLPDFIYFKDKDSKFLRISNSMLPAFPYDKVEDMIGKSDFDFQLPENAKKFFEEEQKMIKSGKGYTDKVFKRKTKTGFEQWVASTKLPMLDENGKIIGIFGITKDITEYKKLELEATEKANELQATEEELQQNLEEMQTTQEDLQRQITENKKIREELEKEMYLMDALMENVPEYIYFKDTESKFIKNSKSHARLFGFSSGKEVYGKSDFDFFADEHARPAFEDEQKIIKTGKPIINLVEKEVKKDGSISWVSTSKMPLRNQKGKIVGTFGISKDITDIKKMESEIEHRLEENEKIKKDFQKKEAELKKSIQELQQKLKKSVK